MTLVKPKPLKPGACFGIFTPSGPITVPEEWVLDAYAYIRSKGYRIKESPICRRRYGHTAGTIMERVKAFHDLLRDPEVAAIMTFWGGLQSHQLLEYLDFDLIRAARKIIVGYSDVTALNIGIYSQARLCTLSGPAVISFCSLNRFSYTWEKFESLATGATTLQVIEPSSQWSDDDWWKFPDRRRRKRTTTGWKVFRHGRARGRLVGGNLGTMLLLAGTPYWPNLRGAILIIEEDADERPGTVDRCMTRLRQMGVFDQISGLVVGRFPGDVGFKKSDSFEMILRDVCGEHSFPVIFDSDVGHTAPIFTVPQGCRAEISTRPCRITILERAVTLSGR